MTKTEIVKTLKEKAELPSLAQAEAAYDSLFNIIKASLQTDGAVRIVGFGGFKVVRRQARKGRNPRTGQEVQIPAGKTIKFTPGKALKDSL